MAQSGQPERRYFDIRYQYDLNGNLKRVYIDGGIGGHTDRKVLNYDPYNKPLLIDDKLSGHTLEFAYGSNDQRFIQLKDGSGAYTIYIDKLFEANGESGNPNTDLEAKLYIGDYAVYDLTLTNNTEGPARAELNYLHRDRLGSVVAMSNSQGAVINMSGRGFDAFGKPREEGWQDSDHSNGTNEPGDLNRNDLSTRGFTGHEHLNETDLIHMNGRVYDYNLGRFLSVDPFIQFPANSQSMNAYSYIMNNPLSGVDPSGYTSVSPDTDMSSSGPTGSGSAGDFSKTRSRATTGSRARRESRTVGSIGGKTFAGTIGPDGSIHSVSGNFAAVVAAVQAYNGASSSPTISTGTGTTPDAAGGMLGDMADLGRPSDGGNDVGISAASQADAMGCMVPLRCDGTSQSNQRAAQAVTAGGRAAPIPGTTPDNLALPTWARSPLGFFLFAMTYSEGLSDGAVSRQNNELTQLYRVVGPGEAASIFSTVPPQFTILPSGFGQKQFWLSIADARWFVGAEALIDPVSAGRVRSIVSTLVTRETLNQGYRFSDAGHPAISFDVSSLPSLNRDAAQFGIFLLEEIPPNNSGN